MSLNKEISQLFENEIWDIPASWSWEHMSALTDVVGGGTPSTSILRNFGNDVAWITPADMSRHKEILISKGARGLSLSGYGNSGAKKIPIGSVLFSSRAPIGYVAIAANELTTNQGFKSFVPGKGVNSKYIYYWLIFAKHFAEKLASGTTFLEISGKNSGLLPIPTAPEKEQIRIVEKLEELLSDLDNGVTELKAAQTKLIQYRQSLLKSAVAGTLTQEWREANAHKIAETGEQLLARILKERRARWEQQKLKEFATKNQIPSKDWQKKYPEPVKPDAGDLSELPKGWAWASIDQLAEIGTGVTPLKSRNDFYHNGTIPWVTSGAVNDEIVTESGSLVTMTALDECRLKIYPAGTLLVAMYGEGKTRGKCSELGIPTTINQALAALVLEGLSFHIKEFLKIFLLDSYQKMRGQASGGVQPNLNLLIVRSMCLPLPPIEEQREICMLVTQQQSDINSQRKAVQFGLQASQAQRKNLLKDAFSGRLVEQNPDDEPVSILVERIKAECSSKATQKKLRQVKKKPKTMKNFDLDTLKRWVANYDNDRFTFAEIEAGVSADYENLKSIVFLALSESKPVFYQYFDEDVKNIVFKKAKS